FLIAREGQHEDVKVVDFGIAKVLQQTGGQRLTQAGMVLGTPEYMSPEQATGKDADHRVDEYALGCIRYEMITGEVPIRGPNPARLESVILKAMAKRADDRYPGMKELLQALDDAAAGLDEPNPSARRPAREEAPRDDEDRRSTTAMKPSSITRKRTAAKRGLP